MNDKRKYRFLSPEDIEFTDSLIYNWRSKIATCYNHAEAEQALLQVTVIPSGKPLKSRLITIKADTPAETKIRGFINFSVQVIGEKRFVELINKFWQSFNRTM